MRSIACIPVASPLVYAIEVQVLRTVRHPSSVRPGWAVHAEALVTVAVDHGQEHKLTRASGTCRHRPSSSLRSRKPHPCRRSRLRGAALHQLPGDAGAPSRVRGAVADATAQHRRFSCVRPNSHSFHSRATPSGTRRRAFDFIQATGPLGTRMLGRRGHVVSGAFPPRMRQCRGHDRAMRSWSLGLLNGPTGVDET